MNRDGYAFIQNGLWDDALLCSEHEERSGEGDKYAVEFIRSFNAKGYRHPDGGFTVPNPNPSALAHFVHSTVWKTVQSRYGEEHGLTLGPYEQKIRTFVFERDTAELPFLVGRAPLHLAGQPANIVLPPYRQKLLHWRTWMFVVGGLQFHLKTDQRPFPSAWTPFLGNDNDPVILAGDGKIDILQARTLRPLLEKMGKRK